MRKSRFDEQRIAVALRQAEEGTDGTPVAVRRKAGIGEPSFYAQRKKVWWADAVRVKGLRQSKFRGRCSSAPAIFIE